MPSRSVSLPLWLLALLLAAAFVAVGTFATGLLVAREAHEANQSADRANRTAREAIHSRDAQTRRDTRQIHELIVQVNALEAAAVEARKVDVFVFATLLARINEANRQLAQLGGIPVPSGGNLFPAHTSTPPSTTTPTTKPCILKPAKRCP